MPTRYLIKRYRSSQGAADHQIGQPVGGPRRIGGACLFQQNTHPLREDQVCGVSRCSHADDLTSPTVSREVGEEELYQG